MTLSRHHLYAFLATIALALGAVITWLLFRAGECGPSEYGDEALFV